MEFCRNRRVWGRPGSLTSRCVNSSGEVVLAFLKDTSLALIASFLRLTGFVIEGFAHTKTVIYICEYT